MTNDNLSLNIVLGDGQRVPMNRDTATLYTFCGQTIIGDLVLDNANLDHIFVQLDPEVEVATGIYIFKAFQKEFGRLASFMATHRFPMVLHAREIPNCDMTAYMREVDRTTTSFASEIPDFLPEQF